MPTGCSLKVNAYTLKSLTSALNRYLKSLSGGIDMPLIPKIVIGEKYLYKCFPTEDVCPYCGEVGGTTTPLYEKVVTVIAKATGRQCHTCTRPRTNEGCYLTDSLTYDGRGILAAPYTQLFPIEGLVT